MSRNAKIVLGVATTGTMDAIATGVIKAGPTFTLADAEVGTLSALTIIDCETNTFTMAAVWEVSNDASTWYRLKSMNNVTPTVLATGTAGADADVTTVIEAPWSLFGWRFARCSMLAGVTTGTTSDTYSIQYAYQRSDFS